MTYPEAISFIMSRRKFQKSSSHERIEKLLELLSAPEKSLRFIHVAGTNGKGSVSTALSYILKSAGLKTGLFTSPYILEFGERIQINNEMISHEDIARLTFEIKEKTDLMEAMELYPTVFEVTTALALLYFAREKCDVVILEAGIGGGHDSTNVIPCPLECIFTSISLDHTEMLGDTAEKIAREKSGIIKRGTKVISYPQKGEAFGFIPQEPSAARVLIEAAKEKGCSIYFPDTDSLEIKRSDLFGSEFIYQGQQYKTRLCGRHQVANMLCTIEAAKHLREDFHISDSDISQGIEDFIIFGRMEIIKKDPLIILDGGHNEGCLRALGAMLSSELKDKKINMLMAFMKDKDYETSIEAVKPLCNSIVFTCTDEVRGEKPQLLKQTGEKMGITAYACHRVRDAFHKAMSLTEKDDCLVVCGSFYLVSEIRELLSK